jgi:hypothetical protein
MASEARVYNVTRRYYIKHQKAVLGVKNCAFAWVKYGLTVRSLTLAESIAARQAQVTTPDPLPLAELPNCIFRWPGHEGEIHRERMHAIEANQFAAMSV